MDLKILLFYIEKIKDFVFCDSIKNIKKISNKLNKKFKTNTLLLISFKK